MVCEPGLRGSSSGKLVFELSGLLAEATAALAGLDSASLERLGARASAITSQSGVGECSPGDRLRELEARFRVFAQVVTATGDNLQALARSRVATDGSADAERLAAFDDMERKGYEAAGLACAWPLGRVAQAQALRERAKRI